MLLLSAGIYEVVGHIPAVVVHRTIRLLSASAKVQRFDQRSMLHSMLMGCCALGTYLWELAYADVQYPALVYACMGPSNMIVGLLPPIEAGFAATELGDVLYRRWDPLIFVHGLMTFSSVLILWMLGIDHFCSRLFVVHLSTIFLNLRGIDFGPFVNLIVDAAFAISFVLLRPILLLVWWLQFLYYGFQLESKEWGSCINHKALALILVVGPLIHGLNIFWTRKILRKTLDTFHGIQVRTGGPSDIGCSD